MKSPDGYNPIPPGSNICAMRPYTFTDDTARYLAHEHPGTTVINRDNIADAWKETENGAYVVMPAENSSSNRNTFVRGHYQYITSNEASIVASVQQRVKMCVLGKAGEKNVQPSAVYSHDQALKQSTNHMANYGTIVQHIMPTTVDGILEVSRQNLPGIIALGSRRAGEAHGLEVYADNITNNAFNATEMYVMHRNGDRPVPDAYARYHAMEFKPADEPGTLLEALDVMADHGIDLHTMHTHYPEKNGGPSILAELENTASPSQFRSMVKAFKNTRNEFRFLGSWNERLMTDPMDVPPPYTERLINDSGLHTQSPIHRLDIIPHNQPGILRDILRIIAQHRGNLLDIGSYAIAPRQYGFDIYMNNSDAACQAAIHQDLAANNHVGVMKWQSGQTLEGVRPGKGS